MQIAMATANRLGFSRLRKLIAHQRYREDRSIGKFRLIPTKSKQFRVEKILFFGPSIVNCSRNLKPSLI
jgi:hypothetical protein